MVRQGCRGIHALIASHPASTVVVACGARWLPVVQSELHGVEVCD